MKKNKLTFSAFKKSRKGFIGGEPISFFYSFLAFVIFGLIFFLAFTMKGCSNTQEKRIITDETHFSADGQWLFSQYLQTPISQPVSLRGDGKITLATLISLAVSQHDYSTVEDKTRAFFDREDVYWRLSIIQNNEELLSIHRNDGVHRSAVFVPFASIIPGLDKDKTPITVKLEIGPALRESQQQIPVGY